MTWTDGVYLSFHFENIQEGDRPCFVKRADLKQDMSLWNSYKAIPANLCICFEI